MANAQLRECVGRLAGNPGLRVRPVQCRPCWEQAKNVPWRVGSWQCHIFQQYRIVRVWKPYILSSLIPYSHEKQQCTFSVRKQNRNPVQELFSFQASNSHVDTLAALQGQRMLPLKLTWTKTISNDVAWSEAHRRNEMGGRLLIYNIIFWVETVQMDANMD